MLGTYAVTATAAALRRAKADGAFDAVAAAILLTVTSIVRWERGTDVLEELLELAEEVDHKPVA
jgi:hypothetical protein